MMLGTILAGLKVFFALFGGPDKLLQEALNFWAHLKDVDLAKLQAGTTGLTAVATTAIQANAQVAALQDDVAKSLFQSPMIRFFVGLTIAFCSIRFCLAMFDSTWWWVWGCKIDGARTYGDACSWSIPALKGTYGDAEVAILKFWIIAKPVDSIATLAARYFANLVRAKT
jgi:hypothetical protein